MAIPQPSGPLVPDLEIMINGSPLSVERKSHVIGVTVEADVNFPSFFLIEITGSTTQSSDFKWIDDRNFTPGNSVEIRLGYINSLETVIKGEITAIEPEFTQNRSPSLILRGYDRRYRLQRGRKVRTFVGQKDSDIATQIAQETGLTPQVTDSQVLHDYILQNNQTDLAFLQERASKINYEVVVIDKTLLFRPVGNAAGDSLTLTLQKDLIEFYPSLSVQGQITEVSVQGWNSKEKRAIQGKAKKGAEVSKMAGETLGSTLAGSTFGSAIALISNIPLVSQAEADQMAKAKFNQTLLNFIQGEGKCLGRTDLKAGQVIKIDVSSQRFSGSYYITTVSHQYRAADGYYTTFHVRRNAT